MEAELIGLSNEANFSIGVLFLRASIIVKIVMVVLVLASMWAWAIIIQKTLRFRFSRYQIKKFEKVFWSGKSLDEIYQLLGEKLKLLSENLKVTISFLEEKPLSIDLPTNIECEIESTEGVVKRQTASSSYKPAKLKNGLDIMVPPFVEEGSKIILDTRTLEYVKKINE